MPYNFLLACTQICCQHGLKHLILSPGSRVAPLALAFVRHPEIQTYTLSDERSAAYTALGIAQQLIAKNLKEDSSQPFPLVGLACTSGTAALNYAPAIAEAFYQQIPLLVMTSDRPPEWIDQADNQAIRQTNLYGSHVKASFTIPVETSHPDAQWHAERIFNEAMILAKKAPFGPVHINIPFREPFYPKPEVKFEYPKKVRFINHLPLQTQIEKNAWQNLLVQWEMCENKLIVAGQGFLNPDLLSSLHHLHQDYRVPIVADLIANITALPEVIQRHEIFLTNPNEDFLKSIQPELLITFGSSFLSKSLKNYLRSHPPQIHWHLECGDLITDTFQTMTHQIPMEANDFFRLLFHDLDFKNLLQGETEEDSDYLQKWRKAEINADKFLYTYPSDDENGFSEMLVVGEIIHNLPDYTILHLSNSMPIRYANLWGFSPHLRSQSTDIEIFANRGTSGIDGCLSTAVGAAMAHPEKRVVLIIGDLAFFYDRNGLWNNKLPNNLRIILLNNHGGNIFRMIEGPSQQAELEEYFETEQKLNAENTASDFGLKYYYVQDFETLLPTLDTFYKLDTDCSQILEIRTDKVKNATFYKKFKQDYKKQNERISD
jgi:2-succinyl-5-enolpyruvyl-6-hydroxy-3-cyclohexene-1-carboxylate synthase